MSLDNVFRDFLAGALVDRRRVHEVVEARVFCALAAEHPYNRRCRVRQVYFERFTRLLIPVRRNAAIGDIAAAKDVQQVGLDGSYAVKPAICANFSNDVKKRSTSSSAIMSANAPIYSRVG